MRLLINKSKSLREKVREQTSERSLSLPIPGGVYVCEHTAAPAMGAWVEILESAMQRVQHCKFWGIRRDNLQARRQDCANNGMRLPRDAFYALLSHPFVKKVALRSFEYACASFSYRRECVSVFATAGRERERKMSKVFYNYNAPLTRWAHHLIWNMCIHLNKSNVIKLKEQ